MQPRSIAIGQKIDEFRKQERQEAENSASVKKLTEEVEYLVSRDWRPEFKAKLLLHRKHWDNLDFEIDPELNQRYQTARKIIDSRFEEQNIIEQTHESQQQLIIEVEAFLRTIAGRDLSSFIDTLSETQTKQEQFSLSWQQLADKTRPDLITHDLYEQMLGALHSATQLVLQSANILKNEDKTACDEPEASRQTRADNTLVGKS